ncbi:hypothetical protein ACIPRI_20705 [Variovorax sp. LARHSF232]
MLRIDSTAMLAQEACVAELATFTSFTLLKQLRRVRCSPPHKSLAAANTCRAGALP